MAFYEILEKDSPFLDLERYDKLTESEKENYPYWVEMFGSDHESLEKLYFHYVHGEYMAFSLYKNFHNEARNYSALIKNNIAVFAQSIQSNADHIKYHVQDRRTLELAKKLQNQQTTHFIYAKGYGGNKVLINIHHVCLFSTDKEDHIAVDTYDGSRYLLESKNFNAFKKLISSLQNITVSNFEE